MSKRHRTSRLRKCICGDPKCEKWRKSRRPLSGMVRVDPIRHDQSSSDSDLGLEYGVGGAAYQKSRPPSATDQVVKSREDDFISSYTTTPEFAELPKRTQKQVLKRLKGVSFNRMYGDCLGLPTRVRRFIKKIWKREDKWGGPWQKIASELAPGANKILTTRMELVMYTSFALEKEDIDVQDDRVRRMTEAKCECDALLCYYAHYFTIGVSTKLAVNATYYAGKNADFFLGGLADVLDYGRIDASERRWRRHTALKAIEKQGWKLPEREHRK